MVIVGAGNKTGLIKLVRAAISQKPSNTTAGRTASTFFFFSNVGYEFSYSLNFMASSRKLVST